VPTLNGEAGKVGDVGSLGAEVTTRSQMSASRSAISCLNYQPIEQAPGHQRLLLGCRGCIETWASLNADHRPTLQLSSPCPGLLLIPRPRAGL